ncbi:uncharacterized protein RJT20DRAFT_2338 [Scheffersomyces xylosifermentans]|uniref:uncharacterized protein n=1 Tax=Scheffersomyces xylosifermentans TaxID=1304137 RepID=UPI00315D7991
MGSELVDSSGKSTIENYKLPYYDTLFRPLVGNLKRSIQFLCDLLNRNDNIVYFVSAIIGAPFIFILFSFIPLMLGISSFTLGVLTIFGLISFFTLALVLVPIVLLLLITFGVVFLVYNIVGESRALLQLFRKPQSQLRKWLKITEKIDGYQVVAQKTQKVPSSSLQEVLNSERACKSDQFVSDTFIEPSPLHESLVSDKHTKVDEHQ